MPFALVFDTDNAAFHDPHGTDEDAHDRTEQVATILANVLEAVEAGRSEGTVRDLNGNTVGNWYYGPDRQYELVAVHPAGGAV